MSGSNDEEALAGLKEALADSGFSVARHVVFPESDLPTAAELTAAGLPLVAVFTGDGTLNAVLDTLAAWDGAVLVLPGGTMNLLSRRLHGDAAPADIIAAVAAGDARRRRPPVIACAAGHAYAGLLAGPGTAWSRVREAMRESAVVDLAQHSVAAISDTLAAPGVLVRQPVMGRTEGYPLIELIAGDHGIEVLAFYAESAGDYLAQALALARRNFREGPHEVLGQAMALTLAGSDGEPFGLLLDGEPADVGAAERFELVPCAVDLLATTGDG